jgi:ribonuclease Z
MAMTLTLHGSGAGTPSGHRMASALTARFSDGSVVLFDAGEGCARAMIRDGVDINRVAIVAISHMHADHWSGLPGLIVGWATLKRRDTPVEILVPPGRVEFLRRAMNESLSFDETLDFTITWRDLAAFSMPDGWRVDTFPTTHLARVASLAERYGVSPFACGYLLRNGDRKIVLSQDVGGIEDLVSVIDGAELLVCEAAHVDPPELLAVARDAHVRRVVFTHIAPKREGAFPSSFDGIEWSVASDGATVEIA